MPDLSDPAALQAFLLFYGARIGIGIGILVVGWLLGKWSRGAIVAACRKAKLDEALGRFLSSLARWAILGAALLAALGHMGIETSSFLAVFASAGLAIGLALQGSLSHIASGVMILAFRPFRIDDIVNIAGSVGTVTDIGLFATTLRTPDGLDVIVPNSKITSDIVVNITASGRRRADVAIGVAYGVDVAIVRAALVRAAANAEFVVDDPAAPVVLFMGFGASSLDFVVRAWATTADFMKMQDKLRDAIYMELEEVGIEIPFMQVVVHHPDTEQEIAA